MEFRRVLFRSEVVDDLEALERQLVTSLLDREREVGVGEVTLITGDRCRDRHAGGRGYETGGCSIEIVPHQTCQVVVAGAREDQDVLRGPESGKASCAAKVCP